MYEFREFYEWERVVFEEQKRQCPLDSGLFSFFWGGMVVVVVVVWLGVVGQFKFGVSEQAQGPCLWAPKKNSPKRKEGERKKGENYIISDLIKSSLIENHYKNG